MTDDTGTKKHVPHKTDTASTKWRVYDGVRDLVRVIVKKDKPKPK